MSRAGAAPLLLYDGDCGFCASSVQFMLRRDPDGGLRFAPLQGRIAAAIRERHPWLAGVESMAWIDAAPGGGERVLVRSAAVLRAAGYLGGFWGLLAAAGRLVPPRLRDVAYNFVAKHRHRLVPSASCYLPTPAERRRFLE